MLSQRQQYTTMSTTKKHKSGYQQGRYRLRNPYKYRGNPRRVFYRSSWELSFNRFLDNNPNVLEWASEEIAISYVKPTDGRVHKYYPDYWVKYRNKQGEILQEVIELKPSKQTRPPTKRGKKPKTQLYESKMYRINMAKWTAAKAYCKGKGIQFRILTERSLFK